MAEFANLYRPQGGVADHGAPTGALESLGSYSQLSVFLRQDQAVLQTRELRESVALLSDSIEVATSMRRAVVGDAAAVSRSVQRLVHTLQQHQYMLTGLGSDWHALREFGGYQSSLRLLTQALGKWRRALQEHSPEETQLFASFERIAWRTLGEALLMLDIYEQSDIEVVLSSANDSSTPRTTVLLDYPSMNKARAAAKPFFGPVSLWQRFLRWWRK